MIKKTITYDDYNEDKQTEDLYFHLTKDVLTNNLHLSDRLESLQETVGGEKRELTTPEKQEILDVVKLFINLSFGRRSEDGKKFRSGALYPEILEDFRDTAAYDAFLWALFQNPQDAMSFMSNVMPKDLVEAARQEMDAQGRKAPQDRLEKQTKPTQPTVSADEEISLDDIAVDAETPEEIRARLQAQLDALG